MKFLIFIPFFAYFYVFGAQSKQKVAIIGGGGYIGSRIYNDLHHIYDITLFDRDSVFKNVIQLSANNIYIDLVRSFHTIIYLGGYTGRKICDKYPQNVYKENVVDILQFVGKMLPNQTFIFASTSAIMEGYGMFKTSENTNVNIDKLDHYSRSMYDREINMKTFSIMNKNSPRLIGLRFGTVIGHSSGQRTDMIYMALLKSMQLYGYMNITDGDSWRAILGINDLVRAICAIIEAPWKGATSKMDIYHLNSFNTRIKAVAKDITKWGIDSPIYSVDNNRTKGFSLSSFKFERNYRFKFQETSKSIIKELVTFFPDSIIAKGVHVSKDISYYIKHDDTKKSIPCPVCGHRHPIEVLDLKEQPLANDFRPYNAKNITKYPLRLMTCPKCYHMFLSTIVDRSKLFTKYLYESGTSKTLLSYFEWLANKIHKQVKIMEKKKYSVLEIACNDGSQLDVFKKMGWNTYCVDPAESIVKTAQKKGHNVFVGFWGTDDFIDIPHTLDVILAQNVLAHVADPVAFLKACAKAMSNNTILYVQTSQCQMHQESQFDTAYHEHISFFTGHSFQEAARLSGLRIVDFSVTPIHGKSCLVSLMREHSYLRKDTSYSLHNRLVQEVYDGITSQTFYIKYREHAYKRRELIIYHLLDLSKKGYVLGAYGAAAKGMVLLQFLLDGNNAVKIDFVVDDAPLKQGTFCPGTNIPVRPTSFLSSSNDKRPLAIIIFAWNFWEEISNKIRSEMVRSSRSVVVILPFPQVNIFSILVNHSLPE
jgi:nucleoside-diphosphate-sugar epimerase